MITVNDFILFSIAGIALLIASYTDLKTREVPDWLNYSLIGIGLSLGLIFSIFYWNITFLLNSLAGFGIAFLIALLMFYTGQWGGGDSKMLMGLGALFGFDLGLRNLFLVDLFVNILLAGAIYGLFYSIYLIIKNKKEFAEEYKKMAKKKVLIKLKKYIIVLSFLILILVFVLKDFYIKLFLFTLLLILTFSVYLWSFVKAVEKSCMYKYVKPDELTEGDWIAKDIKIKGKYFTGPKDLGIEKSKIKKLVELQKKKKLNKVLIKEGIPFIPSFLLAFILTVYFGNLIFLII